MTHLEKTSHCVSYARLPVRSSQDAHDLAFLEHQGRGQWLRIKRNPGHCFRRRFSLHALCYVPHQKNIAEHEGTALDSKGASGLPEHIRTDLQEWPWNTTAKVRILKTDRDDGIIAVAYVIQQDSASRGHAGAILIDLDAIWIAIDTMEMTCSPAFISDDKSRISYSNAASSQCSGTTALHPSQQSSTALDCRCQLVQLPGRGLLRRGIKEFGIALQKALRSKW